MTPATSRRALIGTSAAMLLAGAFEAGATKAAELDGDIIDASRKYVAWRPSWGVFASWKSATRC